MCRWTGHGGRNGDRVRHPPLVDVAATSGSTLLTKEMIDLTPTSRNGVMSLLSMAPGVRSILDIGGDQIAENPNARAFGQSGAMWYTLEGIPSQTLAGKADGQGANWDYQTVDEARVQTLGTDAEFPTRGVQVNALVKSGGNAFHGSGLWAQAFPSLQSNNIDVELAAQGITKGNDVALQYTSVVTWGRTSEQAGFYGRTEARPELGC